MKRLTDEQVLYLLGLALLLADGDPTRLVIDGTGEGSIPPSIIVLNNSTVAA
jgi:hypothetical protein